MNGNIPDQLLQTYRRLRAVGGTKLALGELLLYSLEQGSQRDLVPGVELEEQLPWIRRLCVKSPASLLVNCALVGVELGQERGLRKPLCCGGRRKGMLDGAGGSDLAQLLGDLGPRIVGMGPLIHGPLVFGEHFEPRQGRQL